MATVSVYFDDRKKSKSGTYPVVLKVYNENATRFFPVFHNFQKLKLSPTDYCSSYEATKPKNEHREFKTAIEANLKKAKDIIDGLDPFTFSAFELEYMGNSKNKTDIVALFEQIIFENEEEGRIKNAEAYQTAVRSFLQFMGYKQGRPVKGIGYKEITSILLKDYERYITDIEIKEGVKIIKKKLSISTAGAYSRALRAVYNRAIEEGYVNKSLYPFGKAKSKYQTPAGRKVKKGLSKEQVQAICQLDVTDNPKAVKARDFWLLSYVCNGMQFKDLAFLKYKNIDGDFFHFIRHKIKNTTIGNQTPIVVPITEHVRFMIKTYGNPDKPENYIFPILEAGMDAREQTRAVSNFTRFVSQNMACFAKELGITTNIANMVARHTFATAIIRSGKSIEYAQKAMGHQNKKTTDTYFAGFEDKELMQVNSELLNFDK